MSSYLPATQNQIALLRAANRKLIAANHKQEEESTQRDEDIQKLSNAQVTTQLKIEELDNAQLKTQRKIEELQTQINELKKFKDATDRTLQHIQSNYAKLDERVESNTRKTCKINRHV